MTLWTTIFWVRPFVKAWKKDSTQGMQRGEVTILRRQLTKRFGALPAAIDERLSMLSTAELEDLSVRLFDVKSLDELFAS